MPFNTRVVFYPNTRLKSQQLALMEGVERTNIVVIRNQGQGQRMGPLRRDSYTMEVDRGRNCYTYRGFGHMA